MTSRPRSHGGDEPERPTRGSGSEDGDSERSRGRGRGAGNVAEGEDGVAAAFTGGRAHPEVADRPLPTGAVGPPWPAGDSVTGSARGESLKPPHPRHTIAGARHGKVDKDNTVFLRGHEGVAAQDVREIAAGDAFWDTATQRYQVNGRSYGVEPGGRVFPDSGAGMVKLDRNEYAALKEIARAGGDLSAAPQLSRNPRFTDHPEAVAKAKAIYDGTYEP